MMNDRQELIYIAQMHYFYDSELLRQWIVEAAAGKLWTRKGQLERWKATLEYLEETQHVPLAELMDGSGLDVTVWQLDKYSWEVW